jgi:hypothetical protein
MSVMETKIMFNEIIVCVYRVNEKPHKARDEVREDGEREERTGDRARPPA